MRAPSEANDFGPTLPERRAAIQVAQDHDPRDHDRDHRAGHGKLQPPPGRRARRPDQISEAEVVQRRAQVGPGQILGVDPAVPVGGLEVVEKGRHEEGDVPLEAGRAAERGGRVAFGGIVVLVVGGFRHSRNRWAAAAGGLGDGGVAPERHSALVLALALVDGGRRGGGHGLLLFIGRTDTTTRKR